MEKLGEASKLANTLTVERPFSLPGIFLGTSAFTAAGWEAGHGPATVRLFQKLWEKK
jgi:hypothetical protein